VKAGQVLHRFTAKDGREVVLRTPKWEDLDDLMEFINSLVEEGAEINRVQKVTREEEADWLGRKLAEMEKGKAIAIVGEVDRKVIANSGVDMKTGRMSHVGELGIGIRSGYRDMGIGTEMMKTLIEEARKAGLKVLVLHVFATNERARHVYEKIGFKETGRIPRGVCKNNEYIDDLTMTKEIT